MASNPLSFALLPVGRLVFLSRDSKNKDGKPYVDAEGKPYVKTTAGIAIPKGGESSWKETEWGQQMVARAADDWKNGQHGNPSFSWKVEDGDSTVPNKVGNKNCEKEGYPGHWIIKPSTNFAVKLVGKEGGPTTYTIDDVKPGYFVQPYISFKGNGSTDSPGLYVNLEVLAFSGKGPEIVSTGGGVDPTAIGFGKAPAPAGMVSADAPPSGMSTAPAPAPQPAPPPRTEFTGAVAPPVPPAPPAPASRLTDKARAAGATTEADVLAWDGWTEASLVQHGYLTA